MGTVRPKACIHLPLAKDLAARADAVCKAHHVAFGAPREQLLAGLADAEGVDAANSSLDSGAASEVLDRLRGVSS